ncbi:MAG: hypothetical protein ACYS9C_17010 [Planctomycetota bacterium]|jgi:hypothetical protein
MTKTIDNQQRSLSKTKPNKAKVKIGKMNVSIAIIKDYDNEQQTTNNECYSKQSQTKPILETMDVNFCATGY